jgi:hypothetical protein
MVSGQIHRGEHLCENSEAVGDVFLCSKCGIFSPGQIEGHCCEVEGANHDHEEGPPSAKRRKFCEPLKKTLLNSEAEEYETAFDGRLKSYFLRSTDECNNLACFLSTQKTKIINKIDSERRKYGALKVNMMVECTFINILAEESNRAFKTVNRPVYLESDLDLFVELSFKKLITEMEESQMKKSGWTLFKVDSLRLKINKFKPFHGKGFIPLPPALQARKACINVQNYDDYCFRYAILSKYVKFHPERPSSYNNLVNSLDFSCITFPVKIKDVKKFENTNNVSINLFGVEKTNSIYPLKVCKEEKKDHWDLLILENGRNWHYVYIKHFERLTRHQITKHEHKVCICKRCFSHFDNRHGSSCEEKLKLHKTYCNSNTPLRIDLPSEHPFVKFEMVERQLRVPIAIYADFESILKPIHGNNPSPDESYTRHYQLHEPMSFCVYVKTSFPCSGLPTEPYIYRGREGEGDVARHFVNYLIQLAQTIKVIYNRNEVMVFNESNADSFRRADRCYLCDNKFNNDKVRDHCHLTGAYRGAACNSCNLRCRSPNFIPVILHNLSGYDSHFIARELGNDPGRIDVIPNTQEKYISFTKHVNGIKLRFLDSYRFMGASLESLVNNLPEEAFNETTKFYCEDRLRLITRKGVFPYDYVDSWQKLEETCLPPKICFNNQLTFSEVSDEDYSHAQKVWKAFNCRTLGEYCDQYLKTDVLLLADVFERFRDLTMESYKLDPCHFYTTPGLTWDAMLKYTKVELELLQDYDMILFFEKGLRGGLCQVSHRLALANNRYMSSYDPESENSFIMYFDANNLYGHAMSRRLPYSGFKWIQNPEEIVISELVEDSDIGYVFEVDVEYPKELHRIHNDLPFLPEAIVPPGMKNGTVKLIPHLNPRSRYVVHYITLKQALRNGLILKKVHRGIQFKQTKWLEPYIRLNTELRKRAKNDFEKDFYKLLNNAVFGKTMENIRNRLNIELVNNPKRLEKLIAKTNFLDRTIYNENLAAIHMKRERLLFNKPLYIGMTILDLSKETMYSFNYDVMLPRYGGERLRLMYMDTDSFIYLIKTSDVYQDMKSLMDHLDTSAYPPEHHLFSLKNKKVLGKFKDEVNGKIIQRFVGLRPKSYALDIGGAGVEESEIKKVSKGVVKASLKRFITIDDYLRVLFEGESVLTKMRSIVSKEHMVSSVERNKVSLTARDDKRIVLENGIETRAFGYID